jgi:UrcA family protein
LKNLLICTAVLALGLPAASFADSPASVGVRYRDLDLNSPRDAALMLHRIDDAATEACGASRTSLREYRLTVERSTCHQEGVAQAVNALDAPTVTALYQDRVSTGASVN